MLNRRQALWLLPTAALAAQDPPEVTIRVDVRLIRVLANVKDSTGALVGGLEKSSFRIFDNGVPQEISVFERTTQTPLQVAVLLDISASVISQIKLETQATLGFAKALLREGNPEDRMSLMTFNYAVDQLTGFTNELPRLERALRWVKAGSGTSLYDAVFLASEQLELREGRKVIIAVTDGGDTASYKKFPDAMEAAQRAEAAVFPILVTPVTNDPGRNVGGENAMQLMAERTGGRVLFPGSFERLAASYQEVLRDLRTQYLLGFYPRGVEGAKQRFHRLRVEVDRPGLLVQARTGYYEETR
ncbi:MAG: VWA domain-containing protein [Bryobacter sp.]|nr:VWA domain-containing protein [Bryobacter sp.]